jgi:predicted ester cyclase
VPKNNNSGSNITYLHRHEVRELHIEGKKVVVYYKINESKNRETEVGLIISANRLSFAICVLFTLEV